MAIYNLNNLYSPSDFLGGLTGLQTGTFTLRASATPDSIQITDDDPILEDNVNAPPQTLDSSQQFLTNAYDSHPAGTGLYSRATGEITVTQPDGTIYTLEMNQVIIGGQIYYAFQHDVPPGSLFNISAWVASGNTPYSELESGEPIVEYEYNQVISGTLASSIIAGTGVVNESDLTSMFVNDQDVVLEDNNSATPQSLDDNIQNLAQPYGPHSAGAYVHARGYYNVTNTTTMETGRLYQIRVSDTYNGQGVPPANGEYWAFSNDFKVEDGAVIIITPGTSFNGLGNVDHVDLFVCFASGTLIDTKEGQRQVQDLQPGDLVLTLDHGYQPIRWIGIRRLDRLDLTASPHLRPIRIRAGALGDGAPSRDLVVSPQHRILISSRIAQRMFGASEVLVAAKHLVELDGIDTAQDMAEVTYVHLLFDRHEVVFSNGARSESLYVGPQTLKSVGAEALDEIFAIFPELERQSQDPEPARLLANGRMGRRIAARHAKNNKPLIM